MVSSHRNIGQNSSFQKQSTVKVNWPQMIQKVVDWFMQITFIYSNPTAADPSHVNALKTLTSAGENKQTFYHSLQSFFAPPIELFFSEMNCRQLWETELC